MYLIHRIEEVAATYDDSRRALAEYVLREHTRLPELTIADVARETYTSKASVTRFAKALGFEGWREFLREFVREGAFERQHAADVDVNFPFAAQDSDGRILENIGNLMAESVAATYAQLDRGMLAMAVRHLQRAERVWVFGRTPNHYYGESFCRIEEDVRGKDVFIVQSTCRPVNDSLMELLVDFQPRAAHRAHERRQQLPAQDHPVRAHHRLARATVLKDRQLLNGGVGELSPERPVLLLLCS